MAVPLWIYSIVFGIVVSAVMAIKTGKDERRLELELIEKEGEIFMRRLELEREKRGMQ